MLLKNGEMVATVWADSMPSWATSSNVAVLHLSRGDHVSLEVTTSGCRCSVARLTFTATCIRRSRGSTSSTHETHDTGCRSVTRNSDQPILSISSLVAHATTVICCDDLVRCISTVV